MYDTVLITTDGSDQAERAVEYGLDLAESTGADVHALYVVETQASYILTVGIDDQEMAKYREYGEEVVTDVIGRAEERGIEGVGAVTTGKTAKEIVDYAEENEVDAIVMGKQGSGAIAKYTGSTAEKVMRMADAPVTVVGPGSR